METGTVSWFMDQKGYGYITPDNGGSAVFVHYTGIKKDSDGLRTLTKGNRVRYEISNDSRGERASGVERIKSGR